jgi:hypothetical protein
MALRGRGWDVFALTKGLGNSAQDLNPEGKAERLTLEFGHFQNFVRMN